MEDRKKAGKKSRIVLWATAISVLFAFTASLFSTFNHAFGFFNAFKEVNTSEKKTRSLEIGDFEENFKTFDEAKDYVLEEEIYISLTTYLRFAQMQPRKRELFYFRVNDGIDF